MKTDINGVSQCPKGTEHYETFTAMGRGQRGTVFFQYDYRNSAGELFSCVKPSLELCRELRDKHFIDKAIAKGYTIKSESDNKFTLLTPDGSAVTYLSNEDYSAIRDYLIQ